MSTQKKSFIESIEFTAAMSVLAIVILGEKAFDLWHGEMRNLIGIPIWLVIAYHFISVSWRSWKSADPQV